jgi:acetyl-CoA C-acetyltransferase
MLLMDKETAKKRGIAPLATIRAIGFAGVDPAVMGIGPVPATEKALASISLSAKDVDFWEINEAFCIVAMHAIAELGIDPEKVNVKGGATAIGHPLGASGVRMIGTLGRILKEKNARWGAATMCCGGGQGVTTVIENES